MLLALAAFTVMRFSMKNSPVEDFFSAAQRSEIISVQEEYSFAVSLLRRLSSRRVSWYSLPRGLGFDTTDLNGAAFNFPPSCMSTDS